MHLYKIVFRFDGGSADEVYELRLEELSERAAVRRFAKVMGLRPIEDGYYEADAEFEHPTMPLLTIASIVTERGSASSH